MEQYLFKKDQVHSETVREGDSFAIDLNRGNFSAWQSRLPAFLDDREALREAQADLKESLETEFSPTELTRPLKADELAAMKSFEDAALPALMRVAEDYDEDTFSLEEFRIECTPYQHSRFLSSVRRNEETGALVAPDCLVAAYSILGDSRVDVETCWKLPAPVTEESEQLYAEEFHSGPVALVHVLYRASSQEELQEAVVPRFCSASFQEAIEHFVARHAGLPGSESSYSVVDALIHNELVNEHNQSDLEIQLIRLVENRFEGTVYHFTLEVADAERRWNEDVCVTLRATGEMSFKRL